MWFLGIWIQVHTFAGSRVSDGAIFSALFAYNECLNFKILSALEKIIWKSIERADICQHEILQTIIRDSKVKKICICLTVLVTVS